MMPKKDAARLEEQTKRMHAASTDCDKAFANVQIIGAISNVHEKVCETEDCLLSRELLMEYRKVFAVFNEKVTEYAVECRVFHALLVELVNKGEKK